jgi:hypothetical protein
MPRLLTKRWPWRLATVLAIVLCLAALPSLYPNPYDRVQPRMTRDEVDRLLGTPLRFSVDSPGQPSQTLTLASEVRLRLWDVVVVYYAADPVSPAWRVWSKEKRTRPLAHLWDQFLYGVGLRVAPPAMPVIRHYPLPPGFHFLQRLQQEETLRRSQAPYFRDRTPPAPATRSKPQGGPRLG